MYRSFVTGQGSRRRRLGPVLAAVVLAGALGGCATNLTGFDFPMFGLTKQDKQDPAWAPTEQRAQSSSGLSQQH